MNKILEFFTEKFNIVKFVITGLAAIYLYITIMGMEEITSVTETHSYITGILLTGLFLVAALIFVFKKNMNNYPALLFALISIGALVIVRGALLHRETGDFLFYLNAWITQMREFSGSTGLAEDIGNYNMPYMYILYAISRTEFSALVLIKIVSMAFDVLLAFFAMKLISLKTQSINFQMLAFIAVFAIPTVVLNSSMWGQCDSIYTALAAGGIYYGIREKSKLSFLFAGLAFAFKFQAVFVAPVFLVFLFKNKIKIKDCWVFFAAFFATLLPSVISGRPIQDILSIYFNQAGHYGQLNMNSASIWNLIVNVSYEHFSIVGIAIAFVSVIGLLYFIYVHKDKIHRGTKEGGVEYYIYMAFLFSVIMPFLLPRMHDRFFFTADFLSVMLFFYDKRKWYVPLVVIFASYTAYANYLMQTSIIDMKYTSISMLVVIIIVLRDFVTHVRSN